MRVSTVHNFLVVAFLAVFLTAVHRISEESSAPLTRPLALMKKITSQQNLTAQQFLQLQTLVDSKYINITELQGPQCLLKAYYELSLQIQKYNINMDFNLFDNARYEYHNVRKCSDYFAVLIEKYQFLPGEDIATENTLKLVNELQFNYWEADYFTQSESETRFCIIANEFNSDKIIIRKLQSIIDQNYDKFKLIIADNSSTDNTYLLSEYFTEKLKKTLKFRRNPFTLNKGVNLYKSLEEYNKYISSKCSQDQLVILLPSSMSLIGKNSLKLMQSIIKRQELSVVSFRTLDAASKSIIGEQVQKGFTNLSIGNLYIFKQSMLNELKSIWSQNISTVQRSGFHTHDIVMHHLMREALDKNQTIYRHFDQVVARNTYKYTSLEMKQLTKDAQAFLNN